MKKVLLSFSGGLDTSVCIKLLREKYNLDVTTLTLNLGYIDLEKEKQKALEYGASEAFTQDIMEEFANDYIFPYIRAGRMYEDRYPLATALGRPLIAKYLVEYARTLGIQTVAHGCTGKGNDQVRLDISIGILAPELEIVAPIRELNLTRDWELEYAREHQMDFAHIKVGYSLDENIWGRSLECGIIEDLWQEPLPEMYKWTKEATAAPDQPVYLEIDFEQGIPVALDGVKYSPVQLIDRLNEIGGAHGVGRIDHVENYVIGLKSRELYESPAACILLAGHQALEEITLTKMALGFKRNIAYEYTRLVYDGLYFTRHKEDLDAYLASNQKTVTGTARVKLHKGGLSVVGRKSPHSLYRREMATYDKEDKFQHSYAKGFIELYGFQFKGK